MQSKNGSTPHIKTKHVFSWTSGLKKRRQQTRNSLNQGKRDPEHGQLTGSLVFDEEQLEALLKSVLVHIKLHLHPKRGDGEMGRVSNRQMEITTVQENPEEKH